MVYKKDIKYPAKPHTPKHENTETINVDEMEKHKSKGVIRTEKM